MNYRGTIGFDTLPPFAAFLEAPGFPKNPRVSVVASRGVPSNRVMGQLEPLSPTRTHSKKMAEPLGIRSKENRGDSKMGEKPWLLSGLCWLVYVSFKVSVWLFFSRMRSKGFSFYFGGLGVGTCSLHVAFTTASVRKRRQAPATVRNCSR